MLGSAAEAEDIVQDVWLRWQATDRNVVETPSAFLATTTTRLCINFAQSAQSRRETYVGPWLPEPVDTSSDPALGAERGAKHWGLQSCCSSRNCLLQNVPHMFCAKRSITPTAKSRTFYKWRKPIPANSSPVPVNILQMDGAHLPVQRSSGAYWRLLSVPPKKEIWLRWKVC